MREFRLVLNSGKFVFDQTHLEFLAISWLADMESLFVDATSALVVTATLAHPSPTVELGPVLAASSSHVGAALKQCRLGQAAWEPAGFFSRKLNAT